VIDPWPEVSDVPYFLQGLQALPSRIVSPVPGIRQGEGPGVDPFHRPVSTVQGQPLDAAFLRRDFPILQERIHGHPLVWLDNGATTQKPSAVIDRLARFYRTENSNIHRAAHALAARATDAYEEARSIVARFLHASSSEEIVFVRGTTEGINLVAQSWGRRQIEAGDEIVLTHLEHHANIVPWQQLVHEKGARLRVAPVDDAGQVVLEAYERLFSSRTKLAAFTHVSNALGTVLPIQEMIAIAHRHGARVLLDGAQGVAHAPVDVQALDVDWYVFSGHKIYGPTGIGAVYGKRELLQAMPPWQGGGNMIRDVTFDRTLYQDPPHRFEAGTGNIADAVGLGTALEYVERIGIHAIERAEQDLLAYATPRLLAIPGLRLFGTAAHKAGVLSFVLDGHTPEDVASALNLEGIAVRACHHCAQPILRRFGVEGTVRATLAVYNTHHDVDALVAALQSLAASGI
jgi:cysteine desulfurase/selenocysteine lyase